MTLRDMYISGRLSHADYYGFLAEIIKPHIPVSVARIQQSSDPDLNDIPLIMWDRLDPWIRLKAFRTGAACFEGHPPQWSLCASICIAKAYAKRLAETERECTVSN